MKLPYKILFSVTIVILLLGLCSFSSGIKKVLTKLIPKAEASPGTCYWVGTSNPANWNNAANWSSTSGGGGNTCEGGPFIPGPGTAVVFNVANNNSANIDIDVSVASITVSANTYSGTINAQTHNVTISGALSFRSGTLSMGSGNWTVARNIDLRNGTVIAGTGTLILNGSAFAQTLTTGEQTLNNLIIKNTHASGTVISGNLLLNGNLYLSADGASNVLLNVSTNYCNVTINGNLDFTGTGGGSESILMGKGTWTVAGSVDFTGGTVTPGTSILDLSGSGSQNLTLAGQTLNNLRVSNSSGSNINFVDNISTATFVVETPNSRLVFGAGTTCSFTNINLNGQSARTRIILVSSTPGTKWLFNVTGTQTVAYVNVSDSNASGGNQINSVSSVNSGNNLNWLFTEDQGGIAPYQSTWQFSSAEDFTISDQSKVVFWDNSVKIIPNNFQVAWLKKWHDTHFAPSTGSSAGYGLAIDNDNYIYIAGATTSSEVGANMYGFIAKLDQNMNEIWYKRDYTPASPSTDDAGFHRIAFAPDGNLIAHGAYTQSGQAYSRVLKINPSDGSVIWQTDISKTPGISWVSIWDGGAGPMADSQGNIYVAIANGADPVTWNGEPTKIVKLNADGAIQWTREEALLSYDTTGHWPWDDVWEMAADSEGNTYLSLQSAVAGTNNFDYGLVKYDTNGNRVWTRIEDMSGGDWDSPRGMTIDPGGDYIYQNGNAGAYGNDNFCGILKYDKNGNLLDKKILPITSSTYGNFTYCYGSTVNRFGNWLIQGTYDTGGISVITQYRTEDLSQINLFERTFDGVTPTSNNFQTRAARDRYENMYAVQNFGDYDYSENMSIGVINTINTFPDSNPESGTPLTLVNKTPVSYTTLNGFSVAYGPMDQADVGFQISNNGMKWYFWNGLSWIETTGYDSNTTAEVNQNISKFSDQFGGGQFYFKTFMVTDGTKEVDLASVTITKDLPLGALPATGANNNILLLIISSLSFATFITATLIRRFIIRSDQNC